MRPATRWLLAGLLGLVALYVAWFARSDWPALLVFGLPPALLALAARRGAPRPAFWAGVLALLWFSHGVMVAWSRPAERGLALLEVALAVMVVLAASLPGLRRRFAARR